VVAALHRPVLQDYEAAFLGLGLVPRLVELCSLALLDLAPVASGDHLFVNWDEAYASLVITREGWPLLARTLAEAAATPEALPHEVATTLLYYRERMGGAGLAGAVVRSSRIPATEAVRLLEEPLGLRPAVLDGWGGLGGGDADSGQAIAGALAAALRGAGKRTAA
jgi:hypothetical protein